VEKDWTFRHVGVVVKDLDKTLEYYKKLGIANFDPTPTAVRDVTDELVYGKPVKFKMKGKMVRMGNATLELLQPVEGNGLHMEFLKKYGEGIQHVGFTVDDLEKERAYLVKKGIPICLIRNKNSTFTYFDVRKCGNMIIELIQKREGMPEPPEDTRNQWTFRHVGVVVKDLDKIQEYYESLGIFTLGARNVAVRTHKEELIHGKLIEFQMRVSGATLGPINFELLQPVAGQGPHMEFLNARKGEGGHHLSYAVSDLKNERAKLADKDAPIVIMRPDGYFVTYFDTGKAGNILIELNQLDQRQHFFPELRK
jgi:methylmalonyl-CoA/ethylmalonyl-CoA epimerase